MLNMYCTKRWIFLAMINPRAVKSAKIINNCCSWQWLLKNWSDPSNPQVLISVEAMFHEKTRSSMPTYIFCASFSPQQKHYPIFYWNINFSEHIDSMKKKQDCYLHFVPQNSGPTSKNRPKILLEIEFSGNLDAMGEIYCIQFCTRVDSGPQVMGNKKLCVPKFGFRLNLHH